MKLSAALLLAFTLASVPAFAASDRASTIHYKSAIETVLDNAREIFTPVMTPVERRIESDIRYIVRATGGVTASARITRRGRREVVLSTEMGQVLEWIAVAAVIDSELSRPGCLESYAYALFGVITDNARRHLNGRRLRPIFDPLRHRGPCRGVPVDAFTAPGPGESMARLMEASIAFLYLHEVAHHVLGHVDGDGRDLRIRRAQETAADSWAIRTALKANFHLAAAYPAFALIAGIGGISLEDELRQTHPLGYRRIGDMLREARPLTTSAEIRRGIDELLASLPAAFRGD